jgi:hypothetical protein
VYRAKVEGRRGKGSRKLRWMDIVNVAVERKGVNIESAYRIVTDGGE